MEASTFLVPRKAYSNALKMTASITSPFATMRYCKTLCIRVHTHNGIFETGIMQELLNGKRRKLLTMTMIPNTARIACSASCQKWSLLDQPNRPPHPNQPPPPASLPPPTFSLLLISLFHFSNSFFFPPSALSNDFLACSCNNRYSKAKLTLEAIN
jgi:hypothetical protein